MEPASFAQRFPVNPQLSSFPTADYVAVLAITDTALAMALVVFIFVYVRKRRELVRYRRMTPLLFPDLLERVEKMASEGMITEAVLGEFPRVLDAAMKVEGGNDDVSLTAFEVIHGLTKIRPEAKQAFMILYEVYERVKFGDRSPSPEEGVSFLEAIRKLHRIPATPEAVAS